ncbi:hypothetical protein EI94DRAFT_194754 [Lactarius quietus]|nr:hypothetical protein EI94DRAFT_194754 [Lactarius quietus]
MAPGFLSIYLPRDHCTSCVCEGSGKLVGAAVAWWWRGGRRCRCGGAPRHKDVAAGEYEEAAAVAVAASSGLRLEIERYRDFNVNDRVLVSRVTRNRRGCRCSCSRHCGLLWLPLSSSVPLDVSPMVVGRKTHHIVFDCTHLTDRLASMVRTTVRKILTGFNFW